MNTKLNSQKYFGEEALDTLIGKIKELHSVQEKTTGNYVEITYANLVTLRNNDQLVPGVLYRITDYTTTSIQDNTTTAGHDFDVIVLAVTSNKLAEEAYATGHMGIEKYPMYRADFDGGSTYNLIFAATPSVGDLPISRYNTDAEETVYMNDAASQRHYTGVASVSEDSITLAWEYNGEAGEDEFVFDGYFEDSEMGDDYFSHSNLGAWKIWYCLDNDESRFTWADASNGKGVIYRMIDEFENDCPYDFKNILFKRCLVTDASNQDWIDKYMGIPDVNLPGIECDEDNYIWCYTFSTIYDIDNDPQYDDIKDSSINDQNIDPNKWVDYCDYLNPKCEQNTIKSAFGFCNIGELNSTINVLNNIVVYSSGSYYSDEGVIDINNCYKNIFEPSCTNINLTGSNNTFAGYCTLLQVKGNSNNFGQQCSQVDFVDAINLCHFVDGLVGGKFSAPDNKYKIVDYGYAGITQVFPSSPVSPTYDPYNPLIMLHDAQNDKIISTDPNSYNLFDFPKTNYTPIGVSVCPTESGYLMISLKSMSYNTPDAGGNNTYMYWGGYGEDIPELDNFNFGSKYLPSDKYVFNLNNEFESLCPGTRYCWSDDQISPFTFENGYFQVNQDYIDLIQDFNGKQNTEIILSKITSQPNWRTDATITNNSGSGYYPAAACCWRYSTPGTSQGDWYLPSIGELGYIMPFFNKINNTINRINQIYGAGTAVALDSSNLYWSSTEYNSNCTYKLPTYDGGLGNYGKNYDLYVRAFAAV